MYLNSLKYSGSYFSIQMSNTNIKVAPKYLILGVQKLEKENILVKMQILFELKKALSLRHKIPSR